MILATDIEKCYGELQVLKGISLEIKSGELVAIVGSSGAGKSTLLHILGTLDNADKGTVNIADTSIASLKSRQLSSFRNQKIGFVFQFHYLLPEFTALENICIPALIKGDSRKEAETHALELLDLLNLSERAHHKPAALSGGEQQRVAVARALINNPAVVFADEPSGNLDSKNAEELHQLFFELRKKFNQTFVIVTHNMVLAQQADRIITLNDGRVV
ncbi:MAG: ABC transporter ATP-binding protein [Bacteroidetes bacterium]|nr:ABC transporter ATP-binding protein [Bacteroidota bacterium]